MYSSRAVKGIKKDWLTRCRSVALYRTVQDCVVGDVLILASLCRDLLGKVPVQPPRFPRKRKLVLRSDYAETQAETQIH